jgi:hypothetical protein
LEFDYHLTANAVYEDGSTDINSELRSYYIQPQFGGGFMISLGRSYLLLEMRYSQACILWQVSTFRLVRNPIIKSTGNPAAHETSKTAIGDHIVTPISYSPLPSTNTYINTVAGFGQTINLFHFITLNEDLGVIGLDGEVTFVDVYFGYQQRIRDWLAAYIQASNVRRKNMVAWVFDFTSICINLTFPQHI